MSVRHLSLRGFRSYPSLDLELAGGPHVLAGRNAAGKTNLLEALVVLSLGRSHRTATDQELVAWGHDTSRLEAVVERDTLALPRGAVPGDRPTASPSRLEVVLHAPGQGGRKRVLVNGVPRRPPALGAVLRTVLFAPEDMLLVSGSPSLRRAALDDLVVQRASGAAAAIAGYGRALMQRNALLRRIREASATRDELSYWDHVVCEEGGRILAWRQAALVSLADPLREAHAAISPDEPPLSLRYVSSAQSAGGEDHTDALRRRLLETAEKEVWNGATLVGPHRDDICFELGGRDLSGFASRGQQRTAIVALKLAQLELLTALDGRPPLLLLDDVFSELDPERRAHLVRTITRLPQAILTTTSLADLEPALLARATAWRVEVGRVEPAGLSLMAQR